MQKLDLPLKDYVPETFEEKIITYADNLIFENSNSEWIREGEIKEKIQIYRKKLPERAIEKIIKLHNEIEGLRGGRNYFFNV